MPRTDEREVGMSATSQLPPARVRRRPSLRRGGSTPYLLIVPAVLVLALVAAWPLVKIISLSLEKQDNGKFALFHNGGTTSFVGLHNFAHELADSQFWTVLVRTLIFTAVNVAISVVLGIAIALLLNRVSRWARIVLITVLLFVWAVPSTVSTQIFAWLFNNQFGVVNYLLDKLPGVSMEGHDWFASSTSGLGVVTVVVVWGAIPLLAISLHAGITQIPQDVLEAAHCDGAGPWATLRHVIMPFLRPLLIILITLSVIWDFGVFNQIWFMRNGHPEPGYQTLGIYMYSNGIGSSRYNTGSTLAVLMILALLLVMVVYIRQLFKIGDAE
jgi:N,N'-diacetylchitobiose transport system permease protein